MKEIIYWLSSSHRGFRLQFELIYLKFDSLASKNSRKGFSHNSLEKVGTKGFKTIGSLENIPPRNQN